VHTVARLPEKDRRDLFMATAARMQVQPAIIEKDFWVCWVLDYLFQACPWKEKLIFKGGTSLSKAYAAIQRFSEDVDLVIDWTLLGSTAEEAFRKRTNKKQDGFCDKISERTVQFLQKELAPVLAQDLTDRLGTNVATISEDQLIRVEYPHSFSIDYIRPEIILEIGPKALTSGPGC
jgi:predicted nucleotidyltransferase component of viral defense system